VARGISFSEMARRIGVTEGAIRYHIRQGHVRPLPSGKLDPADADMLRAAQRVTTGPDQRTAQLLKVRVLGGRVKVQRIRLQIERLQGETVERAPIEAALIERSRRMVQRIATWPERRAAEVAEALSIDLDAARRILQRFSAVALAELGDIEAEALTALARL